MRGAFDLWMGDAAARGTDGHVHRLHLLEWHVAHHRTVVDGVAVILHINVRICTVRQKTHVLQRLIDLVASQLEGVM